MNRERIRQLEAFLEKEPNDPFLLYALATEQAEEAPQAAKTYFDRLLADFPDYGATYYHAAALYEALGLIPQADAIYRKGLEALQAAGEAKALGELRMAYDDFREDYEDELG